MTNGILDRAAFKSFAAAFFILFCAASRPCLAAPHASDEAGPASASSFIPANRVAMNEGGVGDVSDEYYACVGQRYGREFRARIALMRKKGRELNYQTALELTGSILQKAQYCANQEKGAKVNLRHLAEALESN